MLVFSALSVKGGLGLLLGVEGWVGGLHVEGGLGLLVLLHVLSSHCIRDTTGVVTCACSSSGVLVMAFSVLLSSIESLHVGPRV